MNSVNKVIILGNLGYDPEIHYMSNGIAVTNISVATKEIWKDKTTGEKKEYTEWHRIIYYNKLAEIVNKFLKKGSQIYLEGRIKTRKWVDKNNIKRYSTEIIGNNIKILNNKNYDKNREDNKKKINFKEIKNNLDNNLENDFKKKYSELDLSNISENNNEDIPF